MTETVTDEKVNQDLDVGQRIDKLYYEPGPAHLASAKTLYHVAKKSIPGIKWKDVQSYLDRQYTQSRHKHLRKTFSRRKVLVLRIDEIWTMDLVFVEGLTSYNYGYSYILTILDIFSRYLWAKPLKSKRPKEVASIVETVIRENGASPYKIWSGK